MLIQIILGGLAVRTLGNQFWRDHVKRGTNGIPRQQWETLWLGSMGTSQW